MKIYFETRSKARSFVKKSESATKVHDRGSNSSNKRWGAVIERKRK